MISVDPLKENNILYLKVLCDEINFDPQYQRDSDIWPLSKRQLFIDSLINGIDVPKLYFHELKKDTKNSFKYAIVDGKQRIETVFSFLNDEFSLSDKFVEFSGEYEGLKGKKYSEFKSVSPRFKALFDAKQLPIYVIKTDDIELIEEMFYRLNEAAPLNAAEKRNSIGGPFPRIVKELSLHKFYNECVMFNSTRYRHYESIAKLLILIAQKKIVDTKKMHLDAFARSMKTYKPTEVKSIKTEASEVLDFWGSLFKKKDHLLKSPSSIPVYFAVYRKLKELKKERLFTHAVLTKFEDVRSKNRELAKENEDSEKVIFPWLEYDRLIQSPNDASSIRFRAKVLLEYLDVTDDIE